MEHPKIGEGDMHLRLVITVLIISCGRFERNASGLLCLESRLRLGNRWVGLNGEHFPRIENFEKIRERIVKTLCDPLAQNLAGRGMNQLRQRQGPLLRLNDRGASAMGAKPEFGTGLGRGMRLSQQGGDKIKTSPVVVLNNAFDSKNTCGLHVEATFVRGIQLSFEALNREAEPRQGDRSGRMRQAAHTHEARGGGLH